MAGDKHFATQIVAGNIITCDRTQPRVEAVAIVADRIVATGSLAQMTDFLPHAPILRPPGEAIIPGIVDSHVHMLITGIEMQRLDLDGVTRVPDILQRIKAHVAEDPDTGWVVAAANFQTDELDEKRVPTRAELDQVCPHRPLLLDQRTHDAIVNSLALKLSGIDRSTPDPVGGRIERDSRGEPTGLLIERPAAEIAYRQVPAQGLHDLAAALRRAQPALHELGITTIAEPGVTAAEMAAYAELHAKGALTMRCLVMPLIDGVATIASELKRIEGLGVRTGFGDEHLRLGALKAYFDGTGSFGTALLREPWPGSDDYCGTQVMPTEDLLALARFCARQRWSLAVHAAGGGALDRILDVFATVHREYDIRELRFSILHAYLWPSADNMKKAAELGVVAAVQPGMQWRLGTGLTRRFGEEAAQSTAPLRSWLEAGVVAAGGSDGPDFPLEPLFGMWQACTRHVNGLERPLGVSQAITADQALHMFTTQSAYGCFCEHDRGSLQPGKLADWVALSGDPLATPVEQLRTIRVLQTWVGAQSVFNATDSDSPSPASGPRNAASTRI
jgi:predicted amidohydrolase YtcJ